MTSLAERFWIVAALFLATSPFALLGNTADALDGTLHYRLGLWGLVYGAFILLMLFHRGTLALLFRCPLLLILTALAALSAFWSESVNDTLSSSAALWLCTLIAAYMALRITPEGMIRLLAVALGLLTLGSALIIALLPEYGIMTGIHDGLWNGLTTHKNALGRHMVLAVVVGACLFFTTRGLMRSAGGALALSALILILGSESATAYVLLAACSALFAILRLSANASPLARVCLLVATLSLAAGMLLVFSDQSALESTLAALGRDPSLTHRTRIWAAALDAISERPWLGYGYDAFWHAAGSAFSLRYTSWNVPHVHNGFLEIWLGLGLPGIILLGTVVLQLLRYLPQRMDPYMGVLYSLVVVTGLVLNVVEFTFLRHNNIFWMLFIYVLLRLKLRAGAPPAVVPG